MRNSPVAEDGAAEQNVDHTHHPDSSENDFAVARPFDRVRQEAEELFYLAAELFRTPLSVSSRIKHRLGKKPIIGYIGWVGHRNLGDEVLFQVIQQYFSRFTVLPVSVLPGETFFSSLGLGGRGFFRTVFLGGGTLINPGYLGAARLANNSGVQLYTIGTGVGSSGFTGSLHPSLEGWQTILRDVSFLSVRGPMSQTALRGAGVTHSTIIGDPALGLTPETPPAFRRRNRLVINLAQHMGSTPLGGAYASFQHVGRVAREFAGEGGELVGIALGNGDHRILEVFRSECKIPEMTIEDHRTSGEALLQTLSESLGLIGVRLHSAVLAACVGVPSILFSYRDKCMDFMHSMENSDFAVPLARATSFQDLQQRWYRIIHEPELGTRIYQKALFWKRRQESYCQAVAEHLLNEIGSAP